ncbi:transcription termination/antitermination protein NusG [Zunongwangia atlantica]|uniref:Transcription antitermination protein nusg n=1 Tax=Zunongwangia atlantica 22II14-10F7 TaxID=1185767 RepID=A0A1Y1SZM7_9FLAO|nr:UpxY family transcription antiterminator [Zunongwangia atlantica]ORL44198.1 transcription antitermination protein nusg [Zunongwangia atlantica 22II14-10F7]
MKWFVLYTKSRFEKKVADRLRNIGYEVYCPLVERKSKWSDRTKIVTDPLFKSYVFVCHSSNPRTEVMNVPGVVQYLYWLGKPAIVKQHEIDTIEEWLNMGEVEDCRITSMSPGDRIKVKNGLLKGEDGVIKEINGDTVKLILSSLGCTVVIKTLSLV